MLAFGIAIGASALVLASRTACSDDLGAHLRESRVHIVYGVKSGWQHNRQDKTSLEKERDLPHGTLIDRRWIDDTGTRKYQMKLLVAPSSHVRIVETMDVDYFTCRSVDRVEFRWGVDRQEYIKVGESLGECPDFTMESNNRWRAERVKLGKGPVDENHVITVETSTIRVTLDKKQWLRKGNTEILESLSTDFAAVALDDVVKLGQMEPLARQLCTELAGLYTLDCQGNSPVPDLAQPRPIDCDFDASFDEPCNAEQQRAFDTRKAKTTLLPPLRIPTPRP
jgi:hypothetical protein